MNRYLLAFIFIFCSCTHGPKTEKKSRLNVLNGEHYETNPNGSYSSIMGVPVSMKRKHKDCKISGTVLLKGDSFITPLNRQKVKLINSDEKVVAEAFTQTDGLFKLQGIFPNGSYKLASNSENFVGELKIDIKSYEIHDLKIFATEK